MEFSKIILPDKQNWHFDNNIFVRGTAFIGTTCLNADDLLKYFSRMEGFEQFKEALSKLNGFFSVIISRNNMLMAGVDRIRSIPLFYGEKDGQLFISSDADKVAERVDSIRLQERLFDEVAETEFLLAGAVSGPDTLLHSVKQIQAGECIEAKHETGRMNVLSDDYYVYRITAKDQETINENDLHYQLDIILKRSIDRLIKYADGRPIVIPLSGGWDSKLIALMIKLSGYSNIYSYSYGRDQSYDVIRAQKVAKLLGIKWIHIPYTNQRWYDWFHKEGGEDYYKKAVNLSAYPILQECPALWDIVKNGLLPLDGVLVPGYIITRYFKNSGSIDQSSYADRILDYYYSMWSFDHINNSLLSI